MDDHLLSFKAGLHLAFCCFSILLSSKPLKSIFKCFTSSPVFRTYCHKSISNNKSFDYYLGLVLQVNQFGVHTCLVLLLTHVMVLEIPVHQLQ